MFHLDDVIILGMAVPEQHRDGSKTVCVAAYHEDLGMIRIFPCSADMGLSRWSKVSVDLEKNKKDSRYESYRIANSIDMLNKPPLSIYGKISRNQRIEILDKLRSPCVADVNTARFSLCVIKPYEIFDVWLSSNPTFDKNNQKSIPLISSDEWLKTKADYPLQPRIRYKCSKLCSGHDQSILEWGAFEWMRKNESKAHMIIDNWKFRNHEYEHYLIIGNQLRHRTSFLVINVVPIKKEGAISNSIKQNSLFGVNT